MLLTNQRLDKLAAARVDFQGQGMLNGSCYAAALLAFLASTDTNVGACDEASDDRPDADLEPRQDGAPNQVSADGAPNGGVGGEPGQQEVAEQGQDEVDLGEEEEEEGIVEGPTLEAYVELARRPSKYSHHCHGDIV